MSYRSLHFLLESFHFHVILLVLLGVRVPLYIITYVVVYHSSSLHYVYVFFCEKVDVGWCKGFVYSKVSFDTLEGDFDLHVFGSVQSKIILRVLWKLFPIRSLNQKALRNKSLLARISIRLLYLCTHKSGNLYKIHHPSIFPKSSICNLQRTRHWRRVCIVVIKLWALHIQYFGCMRLYIGRKLVYILLSFFPFTGWPLMGCMAAF